MLGKHLGTLFIPTMNIGALWSLPRRDFRPGQTEKTDGVHRVNFAPTPLNGIFDKLAGNGFAVAVQ